MTGQLECGTSRGVETIDLFKFGARDCFWTSSISTDKIEAEAEAKGVEMA